MTPERVRLLLVEDDTGMLRDALGAAGLNAELSWAGSAAQAAGVLETLAVDLVLLDLSLPDAAGLAALKRLHALAPEVPIVVLNGLDDDELALQAAHEGAHDFLVKERLDGPLLARAVRY